MLMVSRCLATTVIVVIVVISNCKRAYHAPKGLLRQLGILPGGDEHPGPNPLPCNSRELLEKGDVHLGVHSSSVVAEGTSCCCLALSRLNYERLSRRAFHSVTVTSCDHHASPVMPLGLGVQ